MPAVKRQKIACIIESSSESSSEESSIEVVLESDGHEGCESETDPGDNDNNPELEALETDKEDSDAELSLHDSDVDERIQGEWLNENEERSEDDSSQGSLVNFIVNDDDDDDEDDEDNANEEEDNSDGEDNMQQEVEDLKRDAKEMGIHLDSVLVDEGRRLRSQRVIPLRRKGVRN